MSCPPGNHFNHGKKRKIRYVHIQLLTVMTESTTNAKRRKKLPSVDAIDLPAARYCDVKSGIFPSWVGGGVPRCIIQP
jgi:hypothetical protein